MGNVIDSAHVAWMKLMNDILARGSRADPRGMRTRELLGYSTMFDMRAPVVNPLGRNISYKFMFAEAAWILSGRNDVDVIATYNRAIRKYSDDGFFMAGAYGPAILDQLPYVINCLNKDMDSRQAVMTIWRPRPYPSKDIPCTLSLQFLWRGDDLHTIVNMRSSDAWLGVPYDWFTFSMVSAYVALHLSPRPNVGTLYWQVGSQHLYHDNEQSYVELKRENPMLDSELYPGFFNVHNFFHQGELLAWLWTEADKWLSGKNSMDNVESVL